MKGILNISIFAAFLMGFKEPYLRIQFNIFQSVQCTLMVTGENREASALDSKTKRSAFIQIEDHDLQPACPLQVQLQHIKSLG